MLIGTEYEVIEYVSDTSDIGMMSWHLNTKNMGAHEYHVYVNGILQQDANYVIQETGVDMYNLFFGRPIEKTSTISVVVRAIIPKEEMMKMSNDELYHLIKNNPDAIDLIIEYGMVNTEIKSIIQMVSL